MDGNNSNQYKNVFDENGCMKCRDPNGGQKQLSVVTRILDKLIRYTDFIKDERLLLYLMHSEKNGVIVKIHPVCQRELPMKGSVKEILFQQYLKTIGRVARGYVTEFTWKTYCFYCESPRVPDPKYPERKVYYQAECAEKLGSKKWKLA